MIALDVELQQGTFTLAACVTIDSRAAALFGPSGAGKTTVLDTIAGLRTPRTGSITIDDRVLFSSSAGINVPPHLRRVGYVPQDVALFPHMNVRRNLLYGRHAPSPQRGSGPTSPNLDRVLAMLEIGNLIDRRVTDLSGGERQRVALGRALMSAPSLLLLDEPLAAVDVPLRRRIMPYLQRVRDELRIPIVYVSHDREEIESLADTVIRVDNGRIVGVEETGSSSRKGA
ncbi:MAG TPA: ATP-binding cassette domain-containing protein [Vicinamibacterales bacterium]